MEWCFQGKNEYDQHKIETKKQVQIVHCISDEILGFLRVQIMVFFSVHQSELSKIPSCVLIKFVLAFLGELSKLKKKKNKKNIYVNSNGSFNITL